MGHLQRKLKTQKMMMTKNLNKMEPTIAAFKKVGSEGGSAARLKMKAEEMVMFIGNYDVIQSDEVMRKSKS